MLKAVLLPRKGFYALVGLPKIEANWQGVKADTQALKQYHLTLNLVQNQNLPLLYPHVLAGGMHMHMLTNRHFPIGLLGAVHLKNRIHQKRPIQATELMDIHTELGQWRVTDKGLEFDFSTQVFINSQLVWSEISTYFKRGQFANHQHQESTQNDAAPVELETIIDSTSVSHWFIPKDRGKAYARLSGDYNPIHISKHLAKLFGLKRDIAHGFGVFAHASAIEDVLPLSQSIGVLELDTLF